jgi:FkbM family methyltransferase
MNILNIFFKSSAKKMPQQNKLWPDFVTTYQSFLDKLISIGFNFSNIDNKCLLVKFKNLSFEVRTGEDIYILHEIYYQGCYNFNTKEEYCVIDIGLNVGLASLYFSNMENVKKIYSYEPFSKTFAQAIKNFSYNQTAKEKIIAFNYGLGESNRDLELEYCDMWKGSLGINGLNKYKKENNIISIEKVIIKDISEEFSNIIKEQKTEFVFKIDCEGAEYEILKRLKETNLLSIAKIYMIEWHFKGCEGIIEDLTTAGYNCVSLYYDDRVSGVIYAFKK